MNGGDVVRHSASFSHERGPSPARYRWAYVTPHDLRRTWGRPALEAEVLPSVVTQRGGREDYETFRKHYLGEHSEQVQTLEAAKAGGSSARDWIFAFRMEERAGATGHR